MQFESNDTSGLFCDNDSLHSSASQVKSDTCITNSIIKIYVFQPGNIIHQIKLNQNESISILSRVYPEDSIYIFNGSVLDTSKSLSYYKIHDQSKIVVITSNMMKSNPDLPEKWLNITSDQDNFEANVNLNLSSSNRKEIARIKDISFYKFEIKRKKYDKLIKSHYNFNQTIENKLSNKNNDGIKLNIDYNQVKSPSINPLPFPS